MKLHEMTWPEVQGTSRDVVVLYPIAALEQHSRHLPLFTDAFICRAVAEKIEAALPEDVLLLPTQWLGASAHHLGMPGTLSAEFQTLTQLICEPLRCLLRHGFKRAFVLNGHGGNTDTWHMALRQLQLEAPEALLCGADYWDLAGREMAAVLEGAQKVMGHACEAETALMLHLHPGLVRLAEVADDHCQAHSEVLRGVYFPLDMAHQTRHGGHGEATKASQETGRALMEVFVRRGIEALQALSSKRG